MHSINDFFDGIYCINLDRRPARWQEAQKEFEKAGIVKYKRFPAIEHSNGWEGCKASHLAIIQQAKDLGLRNVLIFEDDIQFSKRCQKTLKNAIRQIASADWDMLYLGGNLAGDSQNTPFSKNWNRIKTVLTTHAYAINHTIFDKVLSEAPDFPLDGQFKKQAIDVYYCQHIAPAHRVYLIHPTMCSQSPGYSDIEMKTVDYAQFITDVDRPPWLVRRYSGLYTESLAVSTRRHKMNYEFRQRH